MIKALITLKQSLDKSKKLTNKQTTFKLITKKVVYTDNSL